MEKINLIKFNIIEKVMKINGGVVVEDLCNGLTAVNLGTTTMYVNNIPLYPGTPGTSRGESYTYGGNEGEVFCGRVDIAFDTGEGNGLILQKIYLPGQTNKF